MDDFFISALLAGTGVAALAGPLGCFVVWRRMAYFGDTLSHSALLGVALGLVLGIGQMPAVIAVGAAAAVLLVLLQGQRALASDTVLGIVSHSALAAGLLALTAMPTVRVDLQATLMGDVLAVTPADLAWIWGGGALVAAALAALWRPLLAVTVDADLAAVEGIPAGAVRLAFTLLIALVVAVAMKVVGVLLITALLVIPAAAARRLAATPEAMALGAGVIGVAAVMLGLFGSLQADLPAGPAIVIAAAALFAAVQLAVALAGLARR